MPDPQRVVSNVTDALKERRLTLGLSHEVVAQRAGIHRSTVSRIEAKKINGSLHVFQAIANALEISLPDIMAEAEGRTKGA